jgi:alanine or glycine:cation symporter, AGCS family
MLRHHFLLPLLIILGLFTGPVIAQEGRTEAGSDGVTAAVVNSPAAQEGAAEEAAVAEEGGGIDGVFATLNTEIGYYVFYPIPLFGLQTGAPRSWDAAANGGLGDWVEPVAGATIPATLPLAVLILMLGAIFFTIRLGFPQFRVLGHAMSIVRGKYDNPDTPGEVTSFQALTAALSATVGLGNIGGVAIAVGTGGPGATFWMILAGLIGMASKLTECTLGQMYRKTRPDGRVMGGAMYYLSDGLKEMGMGGLGKVLAVLFAIICIGASFGGGNTFQVNQSYQAVSATFSFLEGQDHLYGIIMAVLVGAVIIGGIQRIAQVAEKIVPTMCAIFVLACLIILLMRAGDIPAAFASIMSGAFNPDAMFGGALGVLALGFKRAAFSNEAGIGSAAIAHSAAKVPYPMQEGIVAALEPLIDTVIVCTMTALVIVITGAYSNPEYASMVANDQGAALTSAAMKSVLPGFQYVLAVAVILFAFSTMISWSYYGERCWAYLFGDKSSMVYRIIFVVFVYLGAITSASNILNFGDLMIFGMVLPNIIGVVLLSGKVKRHFKEYWAMHKNGELKTYK